MSDVDNFLAHYGKKGMKWGRRKSPNGGYKFSGALPKGIRSEKIIKADSEIKLPVAATKRGLFSKKVVLPKEVSEDASKYRDIKVKAKAKGVSSLTNEEIRVVTNRFQLEKKYSESFPKKKNPIAQLAIAKLLETSGQKSIGAAVAISGGKLALEMAKNGKHGTGFVKPTSVGSLASPRGKHVKV